MAQLLDAQTIYQHLKTLEMDDAELEHFYSLHPATEQYDYLEDYFVRHEERDAKKIHSFETLKEGLEQLYAKNQTAHRPEPAEDIEQAIDLRGTFPKLAAELDATLGQSGLGSEDIEMIIEVLDRHFDGKWTFDELHDALYLTAEHHFSTREYLSADALEELLDEAESDDGDDEGGEEEEKEGPQEPSTPEDFALLFANTFGGLWMAAHTAELIIKYQPAVDPLEEEGLSKEEIAEQAALAKNGVDEAFLAIAPHFADEQDRSATIVHYATAQDSKLEMMLMFLMQDLSERPTEDIPPPIMEASEKVQMAMDGAKALAEVAQQVEQQQTELQTKLDQAQSDLQGKDELLNAATEALSKQRRMSDQHAAYAFTQSLALDRTTRELEHTKAVLQTVQENHHGIVQSKDEELQRTKHQLRAEKRSFPKWMAGTAVASAVTGLGAGVALTLGTQKYLQDKPMAIPADTLNQAKVQKYTPPPAKKPAMDFREAAKSPPADSSFIQREKERGDQQKSIDAALF